MPINPSDDLESFLKRQDHATLVAVLIELASDHKAVQARLARLQLADRPDKLAVSFRKTLTAWRRSTKYIGYGDVADFGRTLEARLDQVHREVLPRHPATALALYESFIEADATFFERVDDSSGYIGDILRAACRYWLQAAARCDTAASEWPGRLAKLASADQYGARDELLRCADLLLDAPALRELVATFESQMAGAIAAHEGHDGHARQVFKISAALSLLSQAMRDPDVMVRAVLSYSPQPNAIQQKAFAEAYLEADRPIDALTWLQETWGHMEISRQRLESTALERLGRFNDRAPIRQQVFQQTLSVFDLPRWLEQLPEASRQGALKEARQLALDHDEPTTGATLLLDIGDDDAAEKMLLDGPDRIRGDDYTSLLPLAQALQAKKRLRGETAVYRALVTAILACAHARAYGHAARYLSRLREIAVVDIDMYPLEPHQDFEAAIRTRHRRITAFWAHVNSSHGKGSDETGQGSG